MGRLSETKEATFVAAVRAMLGERFPAATLLPHMSDGEEGHAFPTAAGILASGRNGGGLGDQCVWVSFPQCHASVVLENARVLVHGVDPEMSWNASVYWSQPATHGGEPSIRDELIVGMDSLGDLQDRIGSALANFDPARRTYTICLHGLGTPAVSLEATTSPDLADRDHEPLADIVAKDEDDALRIYGETGGRSLAMLMLVSEARLALRPQPSPRP